MIFYLSEIHIKALANTTGHAPAARAAIPGSLGIGPGVVFLIGASMSKKGYTDTELLDFLQALNDRAEYTGKCICRESTTGRGWRLGETSKPTGRVSVRRAIVEFIEKENEKL